MALPYIDRALQASPDHEKAVLLLRTKAECYASMGEADMVDTVIAEIAQTGLTSGTLNKAADRYREQGYYEKSIELYQQVLDSGNDKSQKLLAYAGTARSYFQLGDEPAAQQALDELTVRFAGHPQLSWQLYEVGECCRKRKNYPAAKALYNYIATEFPQSYDAMWSAQRCMLMDMDLLDDPNNPAPEIPGKLLQAADDLILNYTAQPGMVCALLSAGEEYYKRAFGKDPQGFSAEAIVEFEKASAIFDKIITQAPVDAKYTGEAYYLTAVGLSRAGRYEEAIAHHQAVVDNWPKHHLAWSSLYWIGNFQQKLKKSETLTSEEADTKSEEAFLALFEEYPGNPMSKMARSQLAMIYLKSHQWEKAVAVYEHILSESPPAEKIPKSTFYLAQAYEGMGQKEMALQTYREFLEAWPELSSAKHAQTAIEKLGGQD